MSKLKLKYKSRDIEIKYNKDTIKELEKLVDYNEFGARKIDKVVNDKMESYIIDKIIDNENKIDMNNYTFV